MTYHLKDYPSREAQWAAAFPHTFGQLLPGIISENRAAVARRDEERRARRADAREKGYGL